MPRKIITVYDEDAEDEKRKGAEFEKRKHQ